MCVKFIPTYAMRQRSPDPGPGYLWTRMGCFSPAYSLLSGEMCEGVVYGYMQACCACVRMFVSGHIMFLPVMLARPGLHIVLRFSLSSSFQSLLSISVPRLAVSLSLHLYVALSLVASSSPSAAYAVPYLLASSRIRNVQLASFSCVHALYSHTDLWVP